MRKKFSNKQVAVIVDSVDDIKKLADIAHNKLYESISLIKTNLYYGVYYKTLAKGESLAFGVTTGWCEVLGQEYFKKHGYELVTIQEFIDGID